MHTGRILLRRKQYIHCSQRRLHKDNRKEKTKQTNRKQKKRTTRSSAKRPAKNTTPLAREQVPQPGVARRDPLRPLVPDALEQLHQLLHGMAGVEDSSVALLPGEPPNQDDQRVKTLAHRLAASDPPCAKLLLKTSRL
jgi:hypothetical protein